MVEQVQRIGETARIHGQLEAAVEVHRPPHVTDAKQAYEKGKSPQKRTQERPPRLAECSGQAY